MGLYQGFDTTAGSRLFLYVLMAIAELGHDLIVERIRDGLAAAHGRKGRRRFKMTPMKIKQDEAMYDVWERTVYQIAETFRLRGQRSTAAANKTPYEADTSIVA